MADDGNPLLWLGGGLLALLGLGAAAWFGMRPRTSNNPNANMASNMARAAATYIPSAPKVPGCGCGKK